MDRLSGSRLGSFRPSQEAYRLVCKVALTEDGGSTWKDRTITTPDDPRVDVIECPTVKVCYPAGRYGRVWVGHFP